jgi:predicted nucleic acid-binding protein
VAVFVDTNVLVYVADRRDEDKQTAASRWIDVLWRTGAGRISYQVLHEYYVTVTRKLEPGLSTAAAAGDVEDLLAWNPVTLSEPTLRRAWEIEKRHRTSFWDALVVAAAQLAGCDVLLTEDLGHDRDFGGLRVVDPFRLAPEETG